MKCPRCQKEELVQCVCPECNLKYVTPELDPQHWAVGKLWGAHNWRTGRTEIYKCVAYDSRVDYLMECVTARESSLRDVSPRALNATFWPAEDRGNHYYVHQWYVRVDKP